MYVRYPHFFLMRYTFFSFTLYSYRPALHSFPTRRSSDLLALARGLALQDLLLLVTQRRGLFEVLLVDRGLFGLADRKSTRLNSSHLVISYAVFCLKKKKLTITLHLCKKNTTKILIMTSIH